MQSYWQLAAGLGVALALSACASNTDAVLTTYDAQSQARIRLFGQNQKPTIMDVCQPSGKTQRINVGGSMGDAFSSFTRTASNHSLGIAPSETTRQLARQDGILSKALYREFAIPAGKPVNLRAAYVGLTTTYSTPAHIVTMREGSCRSASASFVPQAGHDYEVVSLQHGRQCGISVFDLTDVGQPVAVALEPLQQCR